MRYLATSLGFGSDAETSLLFDQVSQLFHAVRYVFRVDSRQEVCKNSCSFLLQSLISLVQPVFSIPPNRGSEHLEVVDLFVSL